MQCFVWRGIRRPEEKQTDVNVAVSVIKDYVVGKFDKMIMISADSDLLPPLRTINELRNDLGRVVEIDVLFPPGNYSSDIFNSPFRTRKMEGYKSRFNKALLPEKVQVSDKQYEIPVRWRNYRDDITYQVGDVVEKYKKKGRRV